MEAVLELEGGGELRLREAGERVSLSCRREADGAGLYKVWLKGPQGREMLLGTLAPEEGELRLRRTLSRLTLAQAGCWPVEGGRCAMAFPFPQEETGWKRESAPWQRFRDPLLREWVREAGGIQVRETPEGFQLCAPLHPLRPFPLAALFCLAQPVCIQNHSHVVFSFQKDGQPMLFR